jgi:heme-degrading monooxygenase HmoA
VYVRLTLRRIRPGSKKALAKAAVNAPTGRNVPGFQGYLLVDLGNNEYASIGFFEDKAAADRWAAFIARTTAKHQLTKHVIRSPRAFSGGAGKVVYSLRK